ncbi:gamma-mobile-trio protein GmtX [Acinetobacter pittii]|uniref:gamma-mobile-trio protein GmtX n=1 Tax=Acinetobacter pittii TaxID=48296 RepID=UPI00062A9F15|nr:gamma-mobile-trio protein GmtX [Acinetobacter pittii]TGU85403.1 hypothetical protein YA64_017190 [Acinetobacter pittii]
MTELEFLDVLKQDASATMQKTLDAIFEICREQKMRGDYDFSVMKISTLGYKRGVPRAQSIRNKSGEKYRTLLNYFAENSPKTSTKNKLSKTDEDWISRIDNPSLQLLARVQAAELKEARQTIKEIIPPNTRIIIEDYKNANINPSLKFNHIEIKALRYLLSTEFQTKWNFKATDTGELVDSEGRSVFKPGTLNALRKALEYLS